MSTKAKEYSKWGLLVRIYSAKRAYYVSGKPCMTDKEYDALESSFVAIHGEKAKADWVCVGFDPVKYQAIKENYDIALQSFKEEKGYV